MSIGTPEIILCLVIALLVLGPDKLPGAARQVGRFMSEFKRITTDVQSQVQEFIKEDPEADRPRPAEPPSPAALAPQVEGRPGNAPALPEAEVDPSAPVPPAPIPPSESTPPPELKHPGTEGFRLIDDQIKPTSTNE